MRQRSHLVYLLLAIGLTTVGQLPAGIYLPSLMDISVLFHVTPGQTQYIVSIYLFSYGASQLIYGPLSDHYGRKPSVIFGLLLFTIGCLISLWSTTITLMYLGALFQGLGLGSVAVISNAVLRDLHHDKHLLTSASIMSGAIIITPLVSPVLGSYLQVHFGWHATFLFALTYGLIILMLTSCYLKETNTNIQKHALTVTKVWKNYIEVFKTPNFSSYGFCRILAISGGTTYAINAPFLFQHLLHLSPVSYAWLSVIPAVGFFIGSMITKKLALKTSINSIINIGATLLLLGSLSLLIINQIFGISIIGIVIPMLIYMCGNGMVFPSTMTGAVLPLGALAGTAAALIGSFQNLGRGFFSSLVGSFHTQSALPLSIIITLLSSICLLLSLRLTYRQAKQGTARHQAVS